MEDLERNKTRRSSSMSTIKEDGITTIPSIAEGIPPQEEKDFTDPKNWSNRKKWANFSIVFCNAFIGYFTSSIYMPATRVLQDYFDTNLTVINATIALFVLSMAVAPLFWAPFSERVGRKPVLVVSMALYTVATIICAISKNLALFFIMRILQGIFSSAASSVGGGVAADLFFPHERGRAMGSLTLATVLGPAFSPLLGGYITQYLGWRWIFYISTIIGGVVLLADIFLMRETLYRPQQFANREKPKSIKSWAQYMKFDPFRGLRLLLRLDVFLMSLPASLGFGWFYFLVTILSPTYNDIYHFSTGSTGLLYLTGGLGNVLGAFIAGQVSDRVYMHLKKRHSSDKPISKEIRLIPFYFGIPLMVVGYLFYGWFIYAQFHWFTPLIGYFMVALGTMFSLVVSMAYLIDCYAPMSASVASAAGFTRNLMAMVFSLAAASIRARLGDGWSYTLAALVNLALYCICVPIVHKFGGQIRQGHPWWANNKKKQLEEPSSS